MTDTTHTSEHCEHHSAHDSAWITSAHATLHCLIGCAIGEIAGLMIGVSLGLGVFFLAGLVSLVIAWLTVSYQATKVALTNPANALRYE